MKVTKEKAASNKASILQAAARLYRENGIEGIGIGQLARSVGLTHGGFYGQFPGGKEQLAAEAIGQMFEPNLSSFQQAETLEEIVDDYLSTAHLDDVGIGCPIPALGADIARLPDSAKQPFTVGVLAMMDAIKPLTGSEDDATQRLRAAQVLASMAGAVLIARAVDDPELSRYFLEAVATAWNAQAAE
ncbi:TetR/AcrR family transcriptional regulator [Pseudomonas sp. NA-150]|uniref:TetR/AcrR family transcriptional regulator n=1 Tax=Pseudomonas sp. NA-150 TaxID=3367525 RepID=UPI0037C58398